MSFQKIVTIHDHEWYFDTAVKRANKSTDLFREKKKAKKGVPPLEKSKSMELHRLQVVSSNLDAFFQKILDGFPQTAKLSPFYQELFKLVLDFKALKKSLGAVNWAQKQLKTLYRKFSIDIKRTQNVSSINKSRNAYYGRVNSVLKQIKKELAYLEQARKVLRKVPVVKTDTPTVVIAGFPNVGKSTLLGALTSSQPRVASYPFTTKQLMLGYATIKGQKVQFVDTPGLLDRFLSERNDIELQSITALKHLADVFVFVFDPTETCGYTMDDQLKLHNELKKLFPKIPLLVVSNKGDLKHEKQHIPLRDVLVVSAKEKKGVKKLLSFLVVPTRQD